MSDINHRSLESQETQIGQVMTVFDREDPCPAFAVLDMGEVWTTSAIRGVSTASISPSRWGCKTAAPRYSLPCIDFHADGSRDRSSDATDDYNTDCNTHHRV